MNNPPVGIFELLKEEHDQIRDLLRIVMAEPQKGSDFEQLRVRVEVHMEGEEEHVFPDIRAAGLREEMLEALEEHHVAKILLGELEDMSDREEAWTPKLKVLAEHVEQHLLREEREMFLPARQKIGRARQEELEAEFRQFSSLYAQAGTSPPRGESPFYREF